MEVGVTASSFANVLSVFTSGSCPVYLVKSEEVTAGHRNQYY